MPEKMERELKAKAKKMGLGKERTGAYVYGTMQKMEKEYMGAKKQKKMGMHSPPAHEKFSNPNKY